MLRTVMTHVLDTSAVLAHYLDEPGASDVDELLAGGPMNVALVLPTWVELRTRLRELVADDAERDRVFHVYTRQLCSTIVLDVRATIAAMHLRDSSPGRLPLVDALIAGAAHASNLVLVHRDPHFDTVPGLVVLRLPTKGGRNL
jgi:predicted nucleic acid-binding protein